jgi:hypothetical protein
VQFARFRSSLASIYPTRAVLSDCAGLIEESEAGVSPERIRPKKLDRAWLPQVSTSLPHERADAAEDNASERHFRGVREEDGRVGRLSGVRDHERDADGHAGWALKSATTSIRRR